MLKKIYLYGSLVIVIILTILVFYSKYKTDHKQESKTASVNYHGFLMLTLEEQNKVPNIAILNLDKSNIRFFDNAGTVNMTPDGLKGKFIGVMSSLPANLVGTQDESNFQLYTVDMKNNFERKQLTKSDTLLKRNPKWSSDGQGVAFMARKNNDEKNVSQNPDDWYIYTTDLDGNEKEVGKGAYPQWSPDSKSILALKSDGLYLYNVADNSSKKVMPLENGGDVLRTTLDVSDDGTLLAMDTFGNDKLEIMKISSWEPFKMDAYKTVNNVLGFCPVFSPDMKDVAMIRLDKKEDKYGNLRLSIYNIENSSWKDIADLSKYSASSISLSVWGFADKNINI